MALVTAAIGAGLLLSMAGSLGCAHRQLSEKNSNWHGQLKDVKPEGTVTITVKKQTAEVSLAALYHALATRNSLYSTSSGNLLCNNYQEKLLLKSFVDNLGNEKAQNLQDYLERAKGFTLNIFNKPALRKGF